MSNKEIESYLQTLDDGLKLAEKEMLKEKALHNETVIISDDDGKIKYIPAKDIIARNPSYRDL